eukprot:Tamp_32913.p2 GENE.Tamp_32913~~Tamp_32913.p2  ORF type:complete len:124 (+),score=14.60 Tamp_32913:110-481(+)
MLQHMCASRKTILDATQRTADRRQRCSLMYTHMAATVCVYMSAHAPPRGGAHRSRTGTECADAHGIAISDACQEGLGSRFADTRLVRVARRALLRVCRCAKGAGEPRLRVRGGGGGGGPIARK